MNESNDRNEIIPKHYELEVDNLGFSSEFQKPIKTKLIIVQPQINVKNDDEPSEIGEVYDISSENNKKHFDQESSSSESIVELDISAGNTLGTRFKSNEVKDSTYANSNGENSKKKVVNNEEIQSAKATKCFEEEINFSEILINPNNKFNQTNFKNDIQRFLLTPPPKQVLVRCQVEKTNNIDKTLLFTNFIFSMYIFESDSVSQKHIETLMIGYPNRKSKKLSYFVSTNPSESRANSSSIIGYIKTNFLGTRLSLYSKNLSIKPGNCQNSNETLNEETSFKQNLNDFNQIGVVFYKNSKFGSGKPRTITAVIPIWDEEKECYTLNNLLPKERNEALNLDKEGIICLENESPVYDEEKKVHVLNFGGRVTERSVKNFALNMKIDGKKKRVYQFGKCKNHYIVDFTYPLCAFQAFAIALSCCQRKIATD